jgi:hypothetical protein
MCDCCGAAWRASLDNRYPWIVEIFMGAAVAAKTSTQNLIEIGKLRSRSVP